MTDDRDYAWDDAVEAMCRRRGLADSSAETARALLCGGPMREWRHRVGVVTVSDLTPALVRSFLDERQIAGRSPATVKKSAQQLRWLGQWAEGELGADPVALDGWRPPREETALLDQEEPLMRADVDRLIRGARVGRDRLIVQVLATTGMRPSELVALNVDSVRLDRRPPRIEVRQGRRPGQTKTAAGVRPVPLDLGGRSIVGPMREYLSVRTKTKTSTAALFLSTTTLGEDGGRARLTQRGLLKMLQRLERRTGIHCNPYRFRHSVCSWLADAGLPEHALMTLMGWVDRSMCDRYYRRRPERVLELAASVEIV